MPPSLPHLGQDRRDCSAVTRTRAVRAEEPKDVGAVNAPTCDGQCTVRYRMGGGTTAGITCPTPPLSRDAAQLRRQGTAGDPSDSAELVFGNNAELQDFLYIYIGSFVGGGLVLNGGLFAGPTGNAAALGPMPVADAHGGTEQLLKQTSLAVLERQLSDVGIPTVGLEQADDWTELGDVLDRWLETAARGLAYAIVAAASLIDIEAAVIDGSFPAEVRTDLIARVATEIELLNTAGIKPPALRAGSLGAVSRALGGATLPLFDQYLMALHSASLLQDGHQAWDRPRRMGTV